VSRGGLHRMIGAERTGGGLASGSACGREGGSVTCHDTLVLDWLRFLNCTIPTGVDLELLQSAGILDGLDGGCWLGIAWR